jgi:hypothetical protein
MTAWTQTFYNCKSTTHNIIPTSNNLAYRIGGFVHAINAEAIRI